jgi:hypothetical protein
MIDAVISTTVSRNEIDCQVIALRKEFTNEVSLEGDGKQGVVGLQ